MFNEYVSLIFGLHRTQVPTFQSVSPGLKRSQFKSPQEPLSPQYEEMVKFVNDSKFLNNFSFSVNSFSFILWYFIQDGLQ